MSKRFKISVPTLAMALAALLIFPVAPGRSQALTAGDSGSPVSSTSSSVTTSSASGTAPETPCDPQFMQAMEARAWLEAQREITQNENLIAKPDSVLEYSCFIGFLNKAASNFSVNGINRQFSETDAWKTQGFSSTSTDTALASVVASALSTYITSNFPNNYLGGRLSEPAKVTGASMATVNGAAGYNCNLMAQIWQNARCQNFNTFQDTATSGASDSTSTTGGLHMDGFRDFLWYANKDNDPRTLPGAGIQACKSLTLSNNADIAKTYQVNLDEAFNKNQAMFVLPADKDKDPDNSEQYKKDDVKTYFELILPSTSCGAAIKTGVTVFRNTSTSGASGSSSGRSDSTSSTTSSQSEDAVCPNPGCSLVNGTCTASN